MQKLLIPLMLLALSGCADSPKRDAARSRSLDPLTEQQIRREAYDQGYRDGLRARERQLRSAAPPAPSLPPPPSPAVGLPDGLRF